MSQPAPMTCPSARNLPGALSRGLAPDLPLPAVCDNGFCTDGEAGLGKGLSAAPALRFAEIARFMPPMSHLAAFFRC